MHQVHIGEHSFRHCSCARLAYAFEQATKARRMPPGVPPLAAGCAPKSTMKE
jgi:hypothetical protein